MIKKIYLFIYTLVIISTYIQTTSAANFNGWGDAATLKVTLRKLELCTGFEDTNANVDASDLTAEMINSKIATDTFCNNPVVIGSGDKEIDIALDTFPYNGVTTSFEAIWMGVPVLTMSGYNFNSRCGESINKNLNMENLIANNEEEYISRAIELSNNKNEYLNLRKRIFKDALKTPLFNQEKFSKHFYQALGKIIN